MSPEVLEAVRLFLLEAARWVATTMVSRCYNGDYPMLPRAAPRMLGLRPPRAGTVVTRCYNGVSRMLHRRHHVLDRLPPDTTIAMVCSKSCKGAQYVRIDTTFCCVGRTSGHRCCIRGVAHASGNCEHATVLQAGGVGALRERCEGHERGLFFFFFFLDLTAHAAGSNACTATSQKIGPVDRT